MEIILFERTVIGHIWLFVESWLVKFLRNQVKIILSELWLDTFDNLLNLDWLNFFIILFVNIEQPITWCIVPRDHATTKSQLKSSERWKKVFI